MVDYVLVPSWIRLRIVKPKGIGRWNMNHACGWIVQSEGKGPCIVLEGLRNLKIKQVLCFKFKTSNNHAKYETLIAGLLLAKDMGA